MESNNQIADERIIIFDTETTGFEPREGHRMVEIGAVEMVNFSLTGKKFHHYINPERAVPESAFNVHGLSDDFLKDKSLFADIIDEFLGFISDATLLAHNANFDMNFLQFQLQDSGHEKLSNRVIDSLLIARQKFPGQKNDLDSLANRLNVDISKRDKHGALLDAEILARVYLAMEAPDQQNSFLQTEPKMGAGAETGAENQMQDARSIEVGAGKIRNFILQTPTEQEVRAHEKMRAHLGDKGFW